MTGVEESPKRRTRDATVAELLVSAQASVATAEVFLTDSKAVVEALSAMPMDRVMSRPAFEDLVTVILARTPCGCPGCKEAGKHDS